MPNLYELLLRIGQPSIYNYYSFYSKTQFLKRQELEKLQYKRTKEILEYAYHNSNFYKNKFDNAHIHPDNFKALKDILKFPITTVSELKEANLNGEFNFFINEKVTTLATTGSTGTPFTFPINVSAQQERTGALLRTIEWYGHTLGKKNARLWRTTKSKHFVSKLKENILGRRLELTIYDANQPELSLLNDKRLQFFCDEIIQKDIEILDGYVSALTLLADYILRNNITNLPVKAIASGAEYLSPQARKLIEKAFNCKVYNRYGGTETSLMAHQCERAEGEELHIMSDKLLLEVIKNNLPAKPGEIGEVVITDFTNKAMPLIRFKVGDVATAESSHKICKCGRGLHLLKSVEGRVNDLFKLPDGTILVSHVWHNLFREQKDIKEFQVIQKKINEVNVNIVLLNKKANLTELKKRVAEFLPGCKITWNLLQEIKPGKGGKFRHSLSEVPISLNEVRTNFIAPSHNVGNIEPYKLASNPQSEKDRSKILKLDWNEGDMKPSPKVLEQLQKAIREENVLNWYPDLEHEELKNKIAKFTNVKTENVLLFVGSDGALDYIAKTFIGNGDKVAIISPTYDQFRVSIQAMGGECIFVYGKNPFKLSMQELVPQIPKSTKIIYLVNPNNPTGILFKKNEVEKLLEAFPDSMVILDEAYIEFTIENSCTDLLSKYSNLVILRTFSKAFCLAGLRIGYMLAYQHYLQMIQRIKNNKEVNSLALVAANAALSDWDYYEKYIHDINQNKNAFVDELTKLGYTVHNSEGNFVMVKVADPKDFVTYLAKNNIFIRDRSFMKQLNGYVRITIGTKNHMQQVIQTIKKYK